MIPINSDINSSSERLGKIRPPRFTDTSSGITLIWPPPSTDVGLTVFRNNGLNVWPLMPINFNVEAVNRRLNRVAILARAGS